MNVLSNSSILSSTEKLLFIIFYVTCSGGSSSLSPDLFASSLKAFVNSNDFKNH